MLEVFLCRKQFEQPHGTGQQVNNLTEEGRSGNCCDIFFAEGKSASDVNGADKP